MISITRNPTNNLMTSCEIMWNHMKSLKPNPTKSCDIMCNLMKYLKQITRHHTKSCYDLWNFKTTRHVIIDMTWHPMKSCNIIRNHVKSTELKRTLKTNLTNSCEIIGNDMKSFNILWNHDATHVKSYEILNEQIISIHTTNYPFTKSCETNNNQNKLENDLTNACEITWNIFKKIMRNH